MARHCVIGAGFSGLPAVKKLLELGEEVVVVDRNRGPGGIWHTGAYEHAHVISSRDTTGMPDFPMPRDYPDFPSKQQMGAYLEAYARHFRLLEHCRFETRAERVQPADGGGWTVTLDGGEALHADTVLICNGHHSEPKEVTHPGRFAGEIMRSDAYLETSQLSERRVLVVGFGNTGCDIAVAAARENGHADISMRGGGYFFPKLFCGIPTAELMQSFPVKTDWMDRLTARVLYAVATGDLSRYGMPRPSFRILDRHPVVNTELLGLVRHGRITPRPDVVRFDGQMVQFADGSSAAYDLVVYAVGYRITLPMVDPADQLVDFDGGLPIVHTQMIAPKVRGLFINGLGQARTGGGPLFQDAAYAIARMAAFEATSPVPITEAIDGARQIRFARRYLGYRSVAAADTRSYSLARQQRALRQLARILDQIGAPDAPSRRGRAEDANLTAAGLAGAKDDVAAPVVREHAWQAALPGGHSAR